MVEEAETETTPSSKRVWIVVAIVIPVLALGWWLGSPLFLDTEVDEAFPLSEGAEVPDDMSQADVEAEMAAAAEDDVEAFEPMTDDMETAAAVATGEFAPASSSYSSSGTATIYELPDGSHILRFEDFEVTNGPDLRVYLTPDPNPSGRDGVEQDGAVELDRLKGNRGNQNYAVPAGVDVTTQMAVVVYCQPFHVTFAIAVLDHG